MKHHHAWGASFLLLAGCASTSKPPAGPAYIFAWPFVESAGMEPRGGTTHGTEVTLITGPSEAWTALRKPGLDKFQRDRAAILAMAGDYRASFDFLETAVFTKSGMPAKPYRSWATERVYVIADSGAYISLQHILVMFYEDEKGARHGPMVQKHWRQDWRYEPAAISEYRGNRLWRLRALDKQERAGAWSQSVFHVDDTPRYASTGRWEHNASFSAWTGGEAWRPLPRREHTVRKDYNVLAGRNRHSILPKGWLHEQDNLKLAVDSAGVPDPALPYLARETGVDRYDLIKGFDFSAGDKYWAGTAAFWAAAREEWKVRLDSPAPLRVSEDCGAEPAFMAFFNRADSLSGAERPAAEIGAAARKLVGCVLSP